jgi:hypothetical protein
MSNHVPSLTVDGNAKGASVQPRSCGPTGEPRETSLAQRVQLFARAGLQMPMLLHMPAAPDASFGHGLPVPQACVQTWIPSAM